MEEVIQHTNSFVEDQQIAVALEGSTRRFSISKALLCSASDYLRKALDGGFKETSEKVLHLPGCDEQTLRLFLYYITKLDIPDFGAIFEEFPKPASREDAKIRAAEFQTALVQLWSFGDAYLMPKLPNLAMIGLINLVKKCPVTVEAAKIAFQVTKDGPLRDFFVWEAIYDYEMRELSPTELDEFGAVPGFVPEIFEHMHKVVEIDSAYCSELIPSQSSRHDGFLVKEA